MKIQSQNTLPAFTETSSKDIPVRQSKASQNAAGFVQEKGIQNINEQTIVNNYFEVFEEGYSEVTIKNLISARLQPAYQLPIVHNFETLSAKANELLDFSLAI